MSAPVPVFIGGAARSGTTLVADMLGFHPALSPVYETDFVLDLGGLIFGGQGPALEELGAAVMSYMDQWTRPLPLRPHNKRDYEQYHHGPHYILFDRTFGLQRTAELIDGLSQGRAVDSFREFVQALFQEHCRLDGKPRWVNKTPRYVLILPTLRHVFPNLRFIHCVRDGRDAACSALTRGWGLDGFKQAAAWWVNSVRAGIEFGRQFPDQYIEVRYEDLLCQSAASIERMLTWVGETGDAADIVTKYQQGKVRIDPSRIGVWRRTLTSEDQKVFQDTAGDMLAHFGYPQS